MKRPVLPSVHHVSETSSSSAQSLQQLRAAKLTVDQAGLVKLARPGTAPPLQPLRCARRVVLRVCRKSASRLVTRFLRVYFARAAGASMNAAGALECRLSRSSQLGS